MVRLTRLNGQALVINSDLIKFVEQAPDTLITLLNGEKLMVRESAEEVVGRVVEFRRSVLQGAALDWERLPGLASPGGESAAAKPSKG
jgi:flagellar protein FlbD